MERKTLILRQNLSMWPYLNNAVNLWNIVYRYGGHSLTLSQTSNFRLLQTERVCRRQFQI